MQQAEPGHSIVIAGAWNAAIFSPAWTAQHLAASEQVSVQVAINQPNLPIRLSFDGLFLEVQDGRLILRPDEDSRAVHARMQDVARKVLQLLPHTPVTAIGVNFKFIENNPSEKLQGLFKLSDNDDLADAGATINSTTIRRQVQVETHSVNLSLDLRQGGAVTLDFNFHRATTSTDAAIEGLAVDSATLRSIALELVRSVYSSTLVEG